MASGPRPRPGNRCGKRETNTTPCDRDALGSIFGNSRSTTVRFRTREPQPNGAAADTFSLNVASQASSTTAGPKLLYSLAPGCGPGRRPAPPPQQAEEGHLWDTGPIPPQAPPARPGGAACVGDGQNASTPVRPPAMTTAITMPMTTTRLIALIPAPFAMGILHMQTAPIKEGLRAPAGDVRSHLGSEGHYGCPADWSPQRRAAPSPRNRQPGPASSGPEWPRLPGPPGRTAWAA